MQFSNMDEYTGQSCQQSSRISQTAARSNPGLSDPRRFDESWVEVSSQPSSSSLSSIGDEIITTGLQVRRQHGRRRRMPSSSRSQQTAVHGANTSSQEEYTESDSDEDRVLTSSTENVIVAEDFDDDSDDGDNTTALGTGRHIFRPQPNAFSHPPSLGRSNSISAALPPHPHSGFTRPSFSQRSQTRVHRGGPNFMSTSAREDNDAALRASLTTLLSCAAAARGLPKTKEEAEAQVRSGGVGPSNQPMDLRLVPESELIEDPPQAVKSSPRKQRSPSKTDTDKSKRSASAGRTPRATKKKKTVIVTEDTSISPTLLTWVVSAGVVVLVSVVGFGAGYVIGREVGRQEALAAGVSGINETSSCGREVIRTSSGSLKRFKWGAVGKSIVA